MTKKIYSALDLAKFICAFLIIGIHTGPLLDVSETANFVLIQVFSRIAVPLFFLISGFLLFSKMDGEREWNDYENVHILKNAVLRIIKLYVIWSIIYLPFNYLLIYKDGITIASILRYLRDFFFTGSYYHLWFLPSLVFAEVAVYYLLKHTSMKITLIISSVLYVIGMFGNVYPELIEKVPYVSIMFSAYIKVFVTMRNGLFFGMMFITLGAYFAKHKMNVNQNSVISFILCILSMIGLIVECFLIQMNGFMRPLTSMYIMLIPSVSFLFMWLITLQFKEKEIYKVLRILSILMYVSHIIFVIIMNTLLPTMNSLLLYSCVVICTLLFSICIYILSKKYSIFKNLYA